MKSLDVFVTQTFLSLETFLQKATTLNIFEALIFNYKVKVNSVEQCSPQFTTFVVDLCNELQMILRESMVNGNDKPECIDKDVTYCDLQPADPDFMEFAPTLQSDQEAGLKEQCGTKSCEIVGKEIDVNLVELKEGLITPELHKENSVYTCEHCNRKYRTSEKFSKHNCKAVPVADLRDDESVDDPDSIASEQERVSQAASDGADLPVYVCTVCFFTFSSRELFNQHVHTDSSQALELMSDCAQLQKHRKFVCSVCGEVYRSLSRIVYHVARCSGGPYQCELCTHVAVTKQQLNRHKKKCHKGVESFFCTECGLGFKRRTSLQKHLVNRHENGQHQFVCDFDGCDRLFLKKIHLTNHKIEVHGMERKFLCQVCGHKFLTQDSLSHHLECHSNKKRFECRFCSKLFATKEKMTFHVRAHTGERPFVCERIGCGKSFVSKAKLMEHLQRHSGEKRHKCSVCGKQYANKPDLRIHLRKKHPSVETVPMDSEQSTATPDSPTIGQHPEPSNVALYPSPLILQVDNAGSQLYNNMQFYQEPLQMVRSVTVPQSVVIACYESVMGM